MLARKFDVDSSSIAFDRQRGHLAMTLRPLIPAYDEAAALAHGWGVMAGCPDIRRLVVNLEVDARLAPVRHLA